MNALYLHCLCNEVLLTFLPDLLNNPLPQKSSEVCQSGSLGYASEQPLILGLKITKLFFHSCCISVMGQLDVFYNIIFTLDSSWQSTVIEHWLLQSFDGNHRSPLLTFHWLKHVTCSHLSSKGQGSAVLLCTGEKDQKYLVDNSNHHTWSLHTCLIALLHISITLCKSAVFR